jgi:hypothetical protein
MIQSKGKMEMANRIGNITIEPDTTDELKKCGIYDLDDFDKIVKTSISLDYDFLLIRGETDNIFTEAIKCIFDKKKPLSTVLIEAINNQLEKQGNKHRGIDAVKDKREKIEEKIFSWLSTVIERLPGRIIIVGGEMPESWEGFAPKSPTEGQKKKHLDGLRSWITRRVVWQEYLEAFNIDIKCDQIAEPLYSVAQLDKLAPKDLHLCLYYNWLDNVHQEHLKNSPELLVNLKKKTKGSTELSKYTILSNINSIIKCLKESGLADICGAILYERLFSLFDKKESVNIKSIPSAILPDKPDISKMQSDKLINCFKKIEEKVTPRLPHCFARAALDDAGNAPDISLFFSTGIKPGISKILKYCRHDDIDQKDTDSYYHENLSGNSIHFNTLYNIFTKSSGWKQAELFFNLVENGIVNIVIADERIANYATRPGIKKRYIRSGIIPIKGIQGLFESFEEQYIADFCDTNELDHFSAIEGDAQKKKYDVFIIHQGILDKTGLLSEKIEEEIDRWKRNYFSMVVVTSGRGTPANIPKNARFIPFSILESTLLTTGISKLTMLKIIFKSLSRRV